MGREIQAAFAAAGLAMSDAGLDQAALDPDRTGVVFGTETMCSEYGDVEDAFRSCLVDGEFHFERWGENALSQIYPLWMLKYLPNMPACHVAIAYDARGPNNSIALGDASSLLAIIEGVEIIRRGSADRLIVGGSSSRVNLTDILWRGDSRLSHRIDQPEAASRPFDANRDGMVLGEGAAAFVLERADLAGQRQADVQARISGWASTFEPPCPRYVPTSGAIGRAIVGALQAAGWRAADVGHVNAHGLSTREDDQREAEAICEVLRDVPVTALKSYFGNLGAGGGAVELAASVLAFSRGQIPVTLNYNQPDPQCPINVVRGQPQRIDRPTAVVLNHSGTGQAAAIVLAAE
jgi:3-oxoacyl-[acyl-carrier-protein] synthase II